MKTSILKKNKYSFSDYFELANPTKDVVAEFGYIFRLEQLNLPRFPLPKDSLSKLIDTFYKKLPRISLNSESARREFLIAPLLFELLDYTNAEIDVEYPIEINDKLRGNIDYLIRSSQNFLIIEAKKADLEKGFTQLAVEMIAMDSYLEHSENKSSPLYGSVTTGDIWRFGVLDRNEKKLFKDIDAFLVPADLENLFSVFLGILGWEKQTLK